MSEHDIILITMNKSLGNMIVTVCFLFLIVLMLTQMGTRIFNNQFHYDEAYNIQIPLNLHNHLRYATFDAIFDMNITTGPTVLIPATFFYNATHPTLPRLVTAIYTLIFLAYLLKKYFVNRTEKILYLVLINLTPLFFLFSTVLLGEMPGFVLLFFSYIAMSRSKYVLAGLLFAFSVLTKNIYIMGAVPLVIYGIEKQILFKKYLHFLAGIAVVCGLWGIFSLSQFHFDSAHYMKYLNEAISFTRSRGKYQMDDIERRFAMISYTLHIGGALFTFITLFIGGYSYIKSKDTVVKMLSVFTITYTLYFICFGATNWYRHFFPAILSLLLIIPSFVTSFFKTLNFERKLIATTMALMLFISVINYTYQDKNDVFTKLLIEQDLLFLDQTNKPYVRQKKILADQYATASFITNNIRPEEKISGFVWLNSPEIAYLANHRIYRDPEQDDVDYVLSSIYDRFLDPKAKIIMEKLPLEEIYSNDTYTLYKKAHTIFSRIQYNKRIL